MFRHNDRVVWTGITNHAIYPRQSTPPFGTLGTFIDDEVWSFVRWDSGQRTPAFDCQLINVRHACDQADRTLQYPLTADEDDSKMLQSQRDLTELALDAWPLLVETWQEIQRRNLTAPGY